MQTVEVRRMRRLLTTVLFPLLLLTLMGFGGRAVIPRGESAKQLVQAAAKALASAKSVRLFGSLPVSGGTEKIDFVMFSNRDLEGSLTLAGDLVDITVVNGTDYYRAPAAYWQKVGGLTATLAKQIAPDWISTPNSSSSGIGNSFQIASLAVPARLNHHWTNDRGASEGRRSRCRGCQIVERRCALDRRRKNAIPHF